MDALCDWIYSLIPGIVRIYSTCMRHCAEPERSTEGICSSLYLVFFFIYVLTSMSISSNSLEETSYKPTIPLSSINTDSASLRDSK